jgi:hypothetical protein
LAKLSVLGGLFFISHFERESKFSGRIICGWIADAEKLGSLRCYVLKPLKKKKLAERSATLYYGSVGSVVIS